MVQLLFHLLLASCWWFWLGQVLQDASCCCVSQVLTGCCWCPLSTLLSSTGGYAFGDCLTQQLGPLWPTNEWPSKHNLAKHDLNKTAAMGAVGAFAGAPASLALYAVMDSIAPGTGLALVAAKFAADQLVGCVLWQAAYMVISEPYRRTFGAFATAQWQQHQQRCASPVSSAGHTAVAAC